MSLYTWDHHFAFKYNAYSIINNFKYLEGCMILFWSWQRESGFVGE